MSEPIKERKSQKTDILGGSGISRGDFLKYAGISAATITSLGLISCNDENNPVKGTGPAISTISPEMGPPGSKVTINGMNFISIDPAQNIVKFGDKKAKVASATNTKLKVIVPEGLEAGKKYSITVSINGSTTTSSTKFTATQANITVDFGSGDVGILNFAYALEQLEAAFYTKVVANYSASDDFENIVFKALKAHEITHAMWFKAVLGSVAKDKRIPSLAGYLDFSSVDFGDGQSILKTAHALEETGVGAYNGAGPLLKNKDYLTEAGKIVSVEARHTSVINLLLQPNSGFFAEDRQGDTGFGVDDNGLGQAFSVKQTLKHAGPFLSDKVTLKTDQIGK
jgi:hypothetical protein